MLLKRKTAISDTAISVLFSKNFLIFYEQGRKMSTWRRYIMDKVQKYDQRGGR